MLNPEDRRAIEDQDPGQDAADADAGGDDPGGGGFDFGGDF